MRRVVSWLVAAVLCAGLAGCGWFGGNNDDATQTSVFDVKPGECFRPPSMVKAELSNITRVPCDTPHEEESYATVAYRHGTSQGSSDAAFPGGDPLTAFAQGACAQRFAGYVGIDYRDSSLFFTYLLPSVRSWEQDDDRNVICFITTTGGTLTTSVKNSKR